MSIFDSDGKIKAAVMQQIRDSSSNILGDIHESGNLGFITNEPATPGSMCPNCNSETLIVTRMLLTGPYSGTISCKSCDFRDSVVAYLGKQMIKVEPLDDDQNSSD